MKSTPRMKKVRREERERAWGVQEDDEDRQEEAEGDSVESEGRTEAMVEGRQRKVAAGEEQEED